MIQCHESEVLHVIQRQELFLSFITQRLESLQLSFHHAVFPVQ